MSLWGRIVGLSGLFLMLTGIVSAQQNLPVPAKTFSGKIGRTIQESDPAHFPTPVSPPKDAPNIVLIMLDDIGYGQFSAFGGGVPSPSIEKLASEGLRYSRFHTAGVCSPTRAALLTGRNPHNAGFGVVSEFSTGYDGYVGAIPRSTATIAEILRQHGYATAMFGKNHNTPSWEYGPSGPFNNWPTGLGFDYFYGFNGGETNQWHPVLYENNRPIPPSEKSDYHLNQDLVDRSIAWMHGIRSSNRSKPFFLYLATGATHAPHHAPKEWIDKFKGKFDMGWDRYREETFDRQKKLGSIPADTKLTPRPSLIKAWDSLTAEQKKIHARQMEVFAAFGAYTDHEIGRLLESVGRLPDAGNTLVIYVVGDNGASAEGGPNGQTRMVALVNGIPVENQFSPQILEHLGGDRLENNFSWGWAWAMSAPFQYYKQVVSHLGAIRNPLVISWPKRIHKTGEFRNQFMNVTDITPTILDAVGIEMPQNVNGAQQKPLDGASALGTFDSPDLKIRDVQYFEVFGNRGIYKDGWFASAPLATDVSGFYRPDFKLSDIQWELYHLDRDFSQSVDLAKKHPEKLRELQDQWWIEAARNNVLPIDWRFGERVTGTERPNSVRDQMSFTYYPGMTSLPESLSPVLRNRSWKLMAKGQFKPGDEGVLITQGGTRAGWALYMHEGKLVFDYNYAQIEHHQVRSRSLEGEFGEFSVRFDYDGKKDDRKGAGASVSLWADGTKIGEGRLERTLPLTLAILEGMDVGVDYGSPVSDQYPFPFPFQGNLRVIEIEID